MQEAEAHLYHVIQEVKQFNPTTGQRVSTPVIQKYGKKAFETVIFPSLKKQRYDVEIIHDPNKWDEQRSQQSVKDQQAKAEAYQANQDKLFNDKVREEVAKQLEALKQEAKESKNFKGEKNDNQRSN